MKGKTEMFRAVIALVGFFLIVTCQDGDGQRDPLKDTSSRLRTCEKNLSEYRWETFNRSVWPVCNDYFVDGKPHEGVLCELSLCQHHLGMQKTDSVTTSPPPDD